MALTRPSVLDMASPRFVRVGRSITWHGKLVVDALANAIVAGRSA
jgi:hypothetical protein